MLVGKSDKSEWTNGGTNACKNDAMHTSLRVADLS
jgi:hypothetical protein